MAKNKAVEKGTGFLKEFKDFISKGNVIDLAVGVIIGGAFSGIVTSLVTNIVTPLISILTGKIAFADLFIALDGNEYATLEAATEAGASTINYGLFIQGVINFLITAFVIFLMVRFINKIRTSPKLHLKLDLIGKQLKNMWIWRILMLLRPPHHQKICTNQSLTHLNL